MFRPVSRFLLCTALCCAPALFAQQDAVTSLPVSVVPHVVKYSGTLPEAPAAASVVEVKFAMYAAQNGGDPLWTETQQVALDPQSKYSVLLGATAPAGLPQNLFANGESRWLGVTLAGQEESPRTLLAATPYSLKASDAETLGGHPASDFALKSAKPKDTTDISTIQGGNGVLVNNTVNGSGTGPTVTLGLDSGYLATLGNQYYAQLGAANMFTSNQSITGNLAVSGRLTTISGAGKLVPGGGVDITFANGVYTIAGDTKQAEAFGNVLWARLAANNTLKGTNTFSQPIAFAAAQTFPGTATLAGSNTFSGANTFSNAITFASGQTFPGAGTITGITTTSPLSGSGTTGSVALSLDTSALETTLNSSYAQLAAINTFSAGSNTFSNQLGVGGTLTAGGQINQNIAVAGYYATALVNSAADSGGVVGQGTVIGVQGNATDTTVGDESTGVYGYSTNTAGIGVEGLATVGADSYGVYGLLGGPSTEGSTYQSTYPQITAGVWADTNLTEVNSEDNTAALLVTADDTVGGLFAVNSPSGYAPLELLQDNANGNIFFAINPTNMVECAIDSGADLTCNGTLSGANVGAEGRNVQTYAVQSSENWIEDFGSGQLSSGSAVITLDPAFKAIVNTGIAYHVYLTPNGNSKGLYVTAKGPASFEVHESNGGHASIAFDYRIVAKHKGTENLRLADITDKMKNPILGKKLTDSEKAAKLAQLQHQRQQARLLTRAH